MICAFDECSKEFEPHRHNQKYCCSECCKGATNKRTRDKYVETKMRLQGISRICMNEGCDTILSRYTESRVCNRCLLEEERVDRERLKRLFGAI